VVKLLLADNRVHPGLIDCDERTPFHYAWRYAHHAVVKLPPSNSKADLDRGDNDAWVSSSLAAECGRNAVMNLLPIEQTGL
jgi:hypothetical protein